MSSERTTASWGRSASTKVRAPRRSSSTHRAPAFPQMKCSKSSTRFSFGPIRHRLAPTGERSEMPKQVNCPCGETVRGESDDELVANVEAHVQSDHPDKVGTMSREQILGMAQAD